jgi:hypothetical protein
MWLLFLLSLLVAPPLVPGTLAADIPPEIGKELRHKDFPGLFFGTDKYRIDPYITAAASLRAVRKEKAASLLMSLAKDRERSIAAFILCRMLFTAKPNGDFRCPGLGQPFFVGDTPADYWPLVPIQIVDGVPFLVVKGYALAGSPESAAGYVRYCLEECEWGTAEFKPKTAAEKQEALKKLLMSRKWKEPLGKEDKEFLSSQLK